MIITIILFTHDLSVCLLSCLSPSISPLSLFFLLLNPFTDSSTVRTSPYSLGFTCPFV